MAIAWWCSLPVLVRVRSTSPPLIWAGAWTETSVALPAPAPLAPATGAVVVGAAAFLLEPHAAVSATTSTTANPTGPIRLITRGPYRFTSAEAAHVDVQHEADARERGQRRRAPVAHERKGDA